MKNDQLFTRRDMLFWLFECGDLTTILEHPDYTEITRADIEAMLDSVVDIASREFNGMADLLDANEPRLEDGKVWNHPRLKPALKAYIDSGFFSAGFSQQWGGMGLPYSVAQMLSVPTMAHAGTGVGYLFITAAAANMLDVVGTAEQKARYLPKLVSGEWFGTMMLSEPHAGSSVGDIRTRAIPQPDGSYHLRGGKMWISGGDHDLSDNIVHMVLAKIENDDGSLTPGSAGVSLFLVPKYRVNADGSLGGDNGVVISGLNHKMGQRGIVNTVPVLGEDTPCVGELLGQPGKGLAGMFHMMNEARIGVGFSAAQLAWFGYRYSLDYAKERTQGRLVPDPATPPVAIIQHADIRRMLLAQKAISEGAMGLCSYAADLVDRSKQGSEDERLQRRALLAVLTPIVKSWPSMHGLEANHYAIQVMGGYGYTRDFPVERMYRDNRLNEIHEGTTGIQSLDLLGRKLLKEQGAGLQVLSAQMKATIAEASENADVQGWAAELDAAMERLTATSTGLAQAAAEGKLREVMANSVTYLDMSGQTVVAWMWLRMALVASQALARGDGDADFYRGKLAACGYFFRYELPKTQPQAELLLRLDTTCIDIAEAEF